MKTHTTHRKAQRTPKSRLKKGRTGRPGASILQGAARVDQVHLVADALAQLVQVGSVPMRQHGSAWVSMCHHMPPGATMGQHGSAWASVGQRGSACATTCHQGSARVSIGHQGPARVSTGQHGLGLGLVVGHGTWS